MFRDEMFRDIKTEKIPPSNARGPMSHTISRFQHFWITQHVPDITHVSDIPGDAGLRHYYRIHTPHKTYIFVDAALEPPIFQAYLQQSKHLMDYALPIPELIAIEETASWAILSDFGDELLIHHPSKAYYRQAMDHLITLHNCPIKAFGRYKALDAALIDEEFSGFQTWYMRDLIQLTLSSEEQALFKQCLAFIKNVVLEQPTVFMHRDYHSRNLLCVGDQLGIIDFQDAMAGPITYDLASLLRDCYITWPSDFSEAIALYYKQKSPLLINVSDEQFLYWFDITGIQRHLKALFTFSRKSLRDQQHQYLDHVPRTIDYIHDISGKYPELRFLHQLSKEKLCLPSKQ
jgi:aminoglycoside/choline kinase family phosphotransferase